MDHPVITTPGGERLVMVPEREYESLVEAREMAEDVAAYRRAKRRLAAGDEELIPAEMVNRMLDGESRVKVWREYRGLSAAALAKKIGVSQAHITQIETGARGGSVESYRKIAKALGITIDDLVD
jgi:DNA-binding XRE family transcriptional regulator